MRAVIQRVSEASVTIDGTKVAEYRFWLVSTFRGYGCRYTEDIQWLSNKLTNLRIFNDADGRYEHLSEGQQRIGDCGEPVYAVCTNKKRQPPKLYQSCQTRNCKTACTSNLCVNLKMI